MPARWLGRSEWPSHPHSPFDPPSIDENVCSFDCRSLIFLSFITSFVDLLGCTRKQIPCSVSGASRSRSMAHDSRMIPVASTTAANPPSSCSLSVLHNRAQSAGQRSQVRVRYSTAGRGSAMYLLSVLMFLSAAFQWR
jgi:hypothetical protein